MQIGLHNLGHHLSKLVRWVWIPTGHPYASALSIISVISPCQTINYTSSQSVCWWLGVPIHSGVQWSKKTDRQACITEPSLSIFAWDNILSSWKCLFETFKEMIFYVTESEPSCLIREKMETNQDNTATFANLDKFFCHNLAFSFQQIWYFHLIPNDLEMQQMLLQ